jgi:hypothetical protein
MGVELEILVRFPLRDHRSRKRGAGRGRQPMRMALPSRGSPRILRPESESDSAEEEEEDQEQGKEGVQTRRLRINTHTPAQGQPRSLSKDNDRDPIDGRFQSSLGKQDSLAYQAKRQLLFHCGRVGCEAKDHDAGGRLYEGEQGAWQMQGNMLMQGILQMQMHESVGVQENPQVQRTPQAQMEP